MSQAKKQRTFASSSSDVASSSSCDNDEECSIAGESRSKSGRIFDAYGDVAQNDGESGHQTRHWLILNAIAA